MEKCTVARSGDNNVCIFGGAAVDVVACKSHDCKVAGVSIDGAETRCNLKDNEVWGNGCGVHVQAGGDPFLSGNTIRDHAEGEEDYCGAGLFVAHDAAGCATVRPDNVFERNEGGNVVRD